MFSLLFEKKFLSFTRSQISIKSSDLLEKFGLIERINTKDDKINIDKDIDFCGVKKTIESMREDSMKYLKESLSDL